MDENEFLRAVYDLADEQGWSAPTMLLTALDHIAATDPDGYLDRLRSIQVEENAT